MRAAKVKGLDPAASLRSNLSRIVEVRLGELCRLAELASRPRESVAQHDMRIAAKRLRYVLEVTAPCLGADADRARKAARDLQDVLGEIHDCDVMLPRVRGTIERLRAEDAGAVLHRAGTAGDLDPALVAAAPHSGAYEGLELLITHLAARRALLFDRFLEGWRAHQAPGGTWERLRRLL
ncbi:MAG: CHAD domain-containing protein [Solirubrobacterales bacterium]